MENKYYIIVNDNERQGPFTVDQLADKISAETLVWNEKLDDWLPAKDVPAILHLLQPQDKNEEPFNPPKSWLLTSLLTFFIFSFIGGAIATYFASKVDDTYLQGNVKQAKQYANKARLFVLLGVILGLIARPSIAYFFYLLNQI